MVAEVAAGAVVGAAAEAAAVAAGRSAFRAAVATPVKLAQVPLIERHNQALPSEIRLVRS